MTLKDREDLKLDLIIEALRSRGTVRLKALGTSMLPSVWPGDQLTIQSAAHDDVVPGDIVLAVHNDRVFVHRLVEKSASQNSFWCITKGDAMPQKDPPAAASELLGRVVSIQRGNRSFSPSRRVSLVHSVLARMFCNSDCVRNLALSFRP
jgi:SOS-response transcriptional repressor LexA